MKRGARARARAYVVVEVAALEPDRRADQQPAVMQPVRCCRMRSFIARAALDYAAPAGLRLAAALAGWSLWGVVAT
jgi:hypothetical protein